MCRSRLTRKGRAGKLLLRGQELEEPASPVLREEEADRSRRPSAVRSAAKMH